MYIQIKLAILILNTVKLFEYYKVCTFWWLCKCDILVDLTGKQIHLPAILVSKVSTRSSQLDTCWQGAW